MPGQGYWMGVLLPGLQRLARRKDLLSVRRIHLLHHKQTHANSSALARRQHCSLSGSTGQSYINLFPQHTSVAQIHVSASHRHVSMAQQNTTPDQQQTAETAKQAYNESELERRINFLEEEVLCNERALIFGNCSIDSIFKTIEQQRICTSHQALRLISFCGEYCTDLPKSERIKRLDHYLEILKPLIDFDISHYNAILKVHLENRRVIDVSKFLAEIEERGLKLDGLTYQNLIAHYCIVGDIEKATTVLEQMKADDLPINQSTFLSLLYGHTLNNDIESVNGVLAVMENYRADKGSDTYMVMLMAAANAGNTKRFDELLLEIQETNTKLDARDYFKLMAELCENNLSVYAASLVPKIPRLSNFLLVVRSALPQILFSGANNLAMHLCQESKCSPRENANHFNYVAYALVQTEKIDATECAKAVASIYEMDFVSIIGVFVTDALRNGKLEKIEALADLMQERHAKNLNQFSLHSAQNYKQQLATDIVRNCNDLEHAIQLLAMHRSDEFLDMLATALVRDTFDIDMIYPDAFVKAAMEKAPALGRVRITTTLIRHLLGRKDPQGINVCASLFLFSKATNAIDPIAFNTRLARSYLHTQSMDDLIAVLWDQRFPKEEGPTRWICAAYNVLPLVVKLRPSEKPEASIDEDLTTMTKIVQELNRLKIGVPRITAGNLNRQLADPQLASLLETAVADFESDYWTEERRADMTQMLKRRNRDGQSGRMKSGEFAHLPEGLDDLRKAGKESRKHSDYRPQIANKLIFKLATARLTQEALAEIEAVKTLNPEFNVSPSTCDIILDNFIRENNLEEGKRFFHMYGNKWFHSSFMKVAINLAEKGEHEQVIDWLLDDVDNKEFIYNSEAKFVRLLLQIYENAGEAEMLDRIVNTLLTKQKHIESFSHVCACSLVGVHLARGDTKAALVAYETGTKRFKTFMPEIKTRLIEQLILDKDMTGIKKIKDILAGIQGEAAAIFDMAVSCLLINQPTIAKKLIDTPGLTYCDRKGAMMVTLLKRLGRRDCLHHFVKLTKNLPGCTGAERDFLYMELINITRDATELNEIWLEMQEEGHTPSAPVKYAIDQRLDGNTDYQVPSTIDHSPQSKKSKSKNREDDRKSRPDTRMDLSQDSSVIVEKLLGGNTSVARFRLGMEHLAKNEKFEEFEKVMKESPIEPEQYSFQVHDFLTGLAKSRGIEPVNQFLAKLDPETRKSIRYIQALNKIYKQNPDIFLSEVKEAQLTGEKRNPSLLLSQREFIKITETHPEFGAKLENLSAEGSQVASLIAARHSCGAGDSENLAMYWARIDAKDRVPITAGRVLIDIDSMEKLRWVSSALNDEPVIVTQAANNLLSVKTNRSADKINAAETLEFVVEKTGTLEGIGTAALNRAIRKDTFKHTNEAVQIIKKRRQSLEGKKER